jgi:uncharacterized membrane protein
MRSNRNFKLIFSIICAGAIADTIFLAHEYLAQNFNACSPNDFFSCSTVANSGYTSLFGVPFWVMGLAWFPLILLVGLFLNREILFLLLMVGNLFTIYLWYLELGVIHAICPLCVSLYAFNYVLTAIVARYLFFS